MTSCTGIGNKNIVQVTGHCTLGFHIDQLESTMTGQTYSQVEADPKPEMEYDHEEAKVSAKSIMLMAAIRKTETQV